MPVTASQQITIWVRAISEYAPMALIPLSLALCIWLGAAKIPRTLLWLAGVALGYGAIQLVLILALSVIYNRPENQLPTTGDVYVGMNLSAVNNAMGAVLYALQLATLGLGFFSVMTYHRRNVVWIIASFIGLAMVPFAFYFPMLQLQNHPNQSLPTTWSIMLMMALLADAAIGLALGYGIYLQHITKERGAIASE